MKKVMLSFLVFLLVYSFILVGISQAADKNFTWEIPTNNTNGSCFVSADLQDYTMHYGIADGVYDQTYLIDKYDSGLSCTDTGIDAGTSCGNIFSCSYTIPGFTIGNWFAAITVRNIYGNPSVYSNGINWTIIAPTPNAINNLQVTP